MLALLIVAAVFWFNPLISNVDILPDIVGYLLVIKAFNKSSYVYDYADDVCVSAKKMCIISGVKLFSITMVSSFDPTMSLLLSFCFGVLELVFGVPFFNKLFRLYSQLVPADNYEAHKRAPGAKTWTIIALAVRLISAVLPDLTALSLDSAFTMDVEYSYIRFKPLFIGFFVIVSLTVSTIWLVKYIVYLRKAITKELRCRCLDDFNNQIKTKTSIFEAKDSIKAIIVISVASLFIFDFTWGYTSVDILQDFVFPLVTVLSLLYLAFKEIYKINRWFWILLSTFAVQVGIDIYEMVCNIKYFEKYNLSSMLKVPEAEDLYLKVCISAVLSSLALIAVTVVIILTMRHNAKKSIVRNGELFSHTDIEYYLKEFDKRTNKNLCISVCLAVLSGIVTALMVVFRPLAEWLILVDMVAQIVLIISFISFALYIHDEVYKRILTFA